MPTEVTLKDIVKTIGGGMHLRTSYVCVLSLGRRLHRLHQVGLPRHEQHDAAARRDVCEEV